MISHIAVKLAIKLQLLVEFFLIAISITAALCLINLLLSLCMVSHALAWPDHCQILFPSTDKSIDAILIFLIGSPVGALHHTVTCKHLRTFIQNFEIGIKM